MIGPPDRTVETVQVLVVSEYGIWQLHIVCGVEIDDPDPPGDGVAGIDLGICTVAAVSFGDGALLYPGGALKEAEYYFACHRAKCDDSTSREACRLDRTQTVRRTHFLNTLTKDIVTECVDRGVGTIVVGNLRGSRTDAERGRPAIG